MAKKSSAKRKKAAKKATRPAKAAKSTARRKRSARAAKPAAKGSAARKVAKKTVKKAAKAAKPALRKVGAKKTKAVKIKAVKIKAKKAGGKSVKAKKAAPKAKPVAKKVTPKPKAVVKKAAPTLPTARAKTVAKKAAPAPARKAPLLDRERRVIRESNLPGSLPSSLVPNQHASAASSGADEMRMRLANNPSGPELAAGDPDVDWQSAATVGDEAPGGDNPTPDQDVVEEIGRALGVQYDDDEELQGGDEIAARDHDRWELDPASSDDFEDR